jgi:hypothetical protein
MVFSDTTNKNGIIQHIEQITNLGDAYISGTNTRLYYWVNLVNQWLHYCTQRIQTVSPNWNYDDANHLDGSSNPTLPIEAFACVDDQQNYGLTSTGEMDSLVVLKVEIRDATTEEYKTIDFTPADKLPDDIWAQDSGEPTSYYLSGGSIIFNCPIDTALIDYFQVTYDRNAHVFTYNDTTAQPGFDQKFHMILAYGPAYEWALQTGNQTISEMCRRMLFGTDNIVDIGLIRSMENFYIRRSNLAYPNLLEPESENF